MKFLSRNQANSKFFRSTSGETSIQMATFFSALAILIALVSTPLLDKATQEYAANADYGIDQTITGSIEKPNRYTIRKSVLDKPQQPR